eukprot:12457308-Alexandrium_andersonii.AAC.1
MVDVAETCGGAGHASHVTARRRARVGQLRCCLEGRSYPTRELERSAAVLRGAACSWPWWRFGPFGPKGH